MNDDDADRKTVENGNDGRDDAGRFAPGGPGGPGRPPGAANKITASLRELVERSVHERNPGGAMAWLNGLEDSVFVRLAEKLLPRDKQLEVASGGYPPINIIMWGELPANQRPPAGAGGLPGAPDDGEARTPSLT